MNIKLSNKIIEFSKIVYFRVAKHFDIQKTIRVNAMNIWQSIRNKRRKKTTNVPEIRYHNCGKAFMNRNRTIFWISQPTIWNGHFITWITCANYIHFTYFFYLQFFVKIVSLWWMVFMIIQNYTFSIAFHFFFVYLIFAYW